MPQASQQPVVSFRRGLVIDPTFDGASWVDEYLEKAAGLAMGYPTGLLAR